MAAIALASAQGRMSAVWVVGGALLWVGIACAIPQAGLFGLVWTAVVVLILAANARRLLIELRE